MKKGQKEAAAISAAAVLKKFYSKY